MKFLPKLDSRSRGFTLVELMVVIAIIAILAVIAATIYSGVQSRARDARRQSDVTAISKALEANKTPGSNTYPQIVASWFAGNTVPAEAADYVPKYSIVYTTSTGTAMSKPTVWTAASANPTTPSGYTSPGNATIAAGVPASGAIYTFQVCALLENGANPENIFCVPSSQ